MPFLTASCNIQLQRLDGGRGPTERGGIRSSAEAKRRRTFREVLVKKLTGHPALLRAWLPREDMQVASTLWLARTGA